MCRREWALAVFLFITNILFSVVSKEIGFCEVIGIVRQDSSDRGYLFLRDPPE
jgi:hypothetical protein